MEARKLADSPPLPFMLSLRIRHPSMDPAELSREFKIKAQHSFRAGDPRSGRPRSGGASLYTESYWLGALTPAGWPLEIEMAEHAHLSGALEQLRVAATQSLGGALFLTVTRFFKTHGERLRRIRAEGGEITLLVTLSTDELRSFTLAPEVSRVLSGLGIAVEIEFASD